MDRHTVTVSDAPKFIEWIAQRGGVAVWNSINISNPGASWSTPAQNLDGSPAEKPTWQAANNPERIITDAREIDVVVPKEVKRFPVSVRPGDGLQIVVSDGGTRRIRRELAKAGGAAWYEFDYMTQEAIILVPSETIALDKYDEQVKLAQSIANEIKAEEPQ